MLDLHIKSGGGHMPLFDLPAALGRKRAARELGDTIEGLIAFLDDLGGDPDLEDDDPLESSGDDADAAWPEWHARGRHRLVAGENEMRAGASSTEDDEPGGDEEDGSFAEDEPVAWFADLHAGPGCIISDPDKGGEEDGEPVDEY